MQKRKTLWSLLGAAALLGVAGTSLALQDAGQDGNVQEKQEEVKAKVGEKAPNFTLKDAEGKEVSLADFEGKNVVIQWINYGCPVCRRVMADGTVPEMIKGLKAADAEVVHLTINSTSNLDIDRTAKYLKDHKVKAPALIDQDGTVGRLYDAKTTPQLYVIDAEGVLRYNGAIDDGSGGRKGETLYAVNALKQVVAGETVSPDTTKPYGCNVKYARR